MAYTKEMIHEIVVEQKKYFQSGTTLDLKFRKNALLKLKESIKKHRQELISALKTDLSRSEAEAYLLDIGVVISEINECLRGLNRWAKPETHFSGISAFPSIFTKVYKMPYGVSLIISPFNFPVVLSLGVLAYSISAGNCAIIKLSSKSTASTEALINLIKDTFPKEYITAIGGGHDVADYLLEEKVDKIFYTGSPKIGRHVMEKASKNLIPVALELGGETGNWAIIRKDADIKDAVRKIAFFKIANAGQICININQVAVAKEISDQFINELKNAFISQIGEKAYQNDEYPKLINNAAYKKIEEEANKYKNRIIFGGEGDESTSKYSPTIIYPVDIDEDIVKHEIFGPLLPVVTFNDDKVEELIDIIESREHGLALYIFTKDIKWAKKKMSSMQYGGGCINEVVMHLAVKGVPFNGVGHSGMGSYHGEWGFKEFSHPSTVLIGRTKFNLSIREHPYSESKNKFVKRLLK